MTTKDDKPPSKRAEPPSPDDSSEILLKDLKRSISDPAMPAVTDEELAAATETQKLDEAREKHDTLPPWAPDKIRREQIAAWNNMAEQMVNVVKTVKINEQKNDKTVLHMRMLVMLVVVSIVGGSVVNLFQGRAIAAATTASNAALQEKLDRSASQQDAMLKAIIKLTTAHALALEAYSTFDPDKDEEAKAALLDAQKAALVAQKEAATSPADKAEVEQKIRQVEEREEDAGVSPDGEPRYE